MPQLLRNIISADAIGQLEQGPGCLTRFPDFTAAVIETIGFGAHVEYEQARMLSAMMPADPGVGMAMYLSQVSAEVRRTLLFKAADVCLFTDEEKRDVFNLVMRALKSVKGQRNAFAHGVWGYTPSLPDAVLLVDVDSLVDEHLTISQGDFSDFFGTNHTYVYRKQDFADAAENARQAHNAAMMLRSFLAEGKRGKLAALQTSLMQIPLIKGVKK